MAIPKILLYYVLTPLSDPDAICLWQKELCESLGLRGRIIVSPQGLNGTVGGELDACKQYIKRTRSYPPFDSLKETVKWSEGTSLVGIEPKVLHGVNRSIPWQQISDFPRLSVKARDELIGFGSPDEVRVGPDGVIGGGTHLSPQAVNDLVSQRGDEVVFFDGRNAYEAAIGRFKDAVVPDVRTSHDFIEQIESGAFDDITDRPVVTYCTGGIRCEFLSAMMKSRGFSEIYQIDGGIVRYGEAFGSQGRWQGSLAVFDGRETIDFDDETQKIGICAVCGRPANRLADCAEDSCLARFVVCDEHAETEQRCTEHGGTVDASPASAIGLS